MKAFIFITLLCLLGLAAANTTSIDSDDVTCEDILAEKVCAKLRKAAEAFKLKADLVDKLIKEALAHGKQKAQEIIDYVRHKIIDAAKDFHCTTVLPEEVCAKIEEVAGKLKIKMAEVEKVMKQIVAKGITKIKEIIEELKKHFFPHLEEEFPNPIVCEDVLAKDVCTQLREAAKKLKIKVEMIDQIIRDLVKEKIHDAKEIIKRVRDKLVELAHNIKCADIINAKVCAKIYEILDLIKVKAKAVDRFIVQLVSKGVTKIKEIIAAIKHHFWPGPEGELFPNPIECEEVLSEAACDALRRAAKVLKINFEKVNEAIREALSKGIRKASEIIAYVREKLAKWAHDFTCEQALSKPICDKLHKIGEIIKVSAHVMDEFIKNLVVKGYTKIKEIIDAIKHHFFPGHLQGVDIINAITCEDVLSKEVCTDLRNIAKRMKVKISEIDAIIRKLVEEKITDIKVIIKKVKEKLVELTKIKCSDILSEAACKEIKDFAAKIKIEAKKVDEIIKKIVVDGVTKAKEIIKKIIEHLFPKP